MLIGKVFTVCFIICLFSRGALGSRTDLPLLDSDVSSKHFSYLVGFDVLTSAQSAAIESMTEHANDNGMKTRRIFASWADLNPEENIFDLDDLEDQMIDFTAQGYSIYVSVTSLDSEGVVDVPERFRDEDSPSGLNGDWVDDLLPDYLETLTRVIALMQIYNGYAISLANEPQFYFEEEFPEGESSFVQFLTSARDHIHSISNDIAVTVTLANHELDSSLCVSIIALSDVVSLNLYGRITPETTPTEQMQVWRDDLATAESQINSKILILQEMGISTDTEGSSESLQGLYVETVTDYMLESSQLRVMYWFLLHDPSEEFLDISTSFPGEYIPPEFIQEIRDSLSGLGMCTLTESGCETKSSWDVFLSSLDLIYTQDVSPVSSESTAISTGISTSFSSSFSIPDSPISNSFSSTSFSSNSFSFSSSKSSSISSGSMRKEVGCVSVILALAIAWFA